jgi:phage shock protein E
MDNNMQNRFEPRSPVKKLLALLLLSLFVTACGHVATDISQKTASSKNILIDVRTPLEYQQGHLNNAVNIPFNKIKEDIKNYAPDKEQTIMVYCQSGKRSDIAVKELKGLGYKNVINAGKFKELKEMEEKRNESNPDQ